MKRPCVIAVCPDRNAFCAWAIAGLADGAGAGRPDAWLASGNIGGLDLFCDMVLGLREQAIRAGPNSSYWLS
ncbi:hypothetical protein AKJ29_08610 [Aliiroseovarius crassostreae]|uniref:Uncharacterized protein n=1 Tax=Aliiroseovarius crassostreae TaxID=154981 RepID=A0A0P7J3Q9_9RHOB|nr:hypothetical protein AKJ29_08610 [Aliiroseovarius crassostreae]